MNRLALLALLCIATSANSTPTVSMTWSGCPGSNPPINRSLSDGPIATIVVSATGFTGPVRAVDVRIGVGRVPYAGIPDAWRFDAAGCAAGGFQALYNAASADCPALVGTNPVTISAFEFANGKGGARFAAVFDEQPTNPSATYTIVRFVFDHSDAFAGLGAREGGCGCVDRPECLSLSYAAWLDTNLEEHLFQVQQSYAVWEDPTNTSHCPGTNDCWGPDCEDFPDPCAAPQPTPARGTTWGAIKGQFR
jgi:hypothetical protein